MPKFYFHCQVQTVDISGRRLKSVSLDMLDYSVTLETMCLFFDITVIAKNCRIRKPSAKVNI
jgi:hypothetical protein